MTEKNRQMEEMMQGIPEWCAQAASADADFALADKGENDGSSSSSSSAPAEVQPGDVICEEAQGALDSGIEKQGSVCHVLRWTVRNGY